MNWLQDKYIRAMNWLNGWRKDHDGWWVRARREHDEETFGPNPHRGFLEEACIAVMMPEDARKMDKGIRP